MALDEFRLEAIMERRNHLQREVMRLTDQIHQVNGILATTTEAVTRLLIAYEELQR